MIGADAIIKCLEAEGVSTVFGYPGVAICPFFNSILDSDIKTVLIRTEQNAAHAASGVALMTGRPGVCAVTSGPGATNVITGIATAFADSIPMICITGQVNSELLGSDVFQGIAQRFCSTRSYRRASPNCSKPLRMLSPAPPIACAIMIAATIIATATIIFPIKC